MNIYCVGRNFENHAHELGNPTPRTPIIFNKSFSTIRSCEPELVAFEKEQFDFEAEIVLKIDQNIKMSCSPGIECVKQVALGIDVTRRSAQKSLKKNGLPWALSKSFKGSSIITDFFDIPLDLSKLNFEFYLNNELRQIGIVSDMIFTPSEIVDFINSYNDLVKGDLIFTGTPAGTGKIEKGDQFTFKIPKLDKIFSGTF